jgi:signal recognition particle receptor subunit beta
MLIIDQVELWDCSGDEQFMHAWPCLANDVHGAIFVVNADSKDEKELDSWQALLPNLKPSQCGIFAHRVVPLPQKPKFKTSNYILIIANKVLSKSVLAYTCLDQDNKTQFDSILAQIYTNYLEKRELDEKNIIA